MAEKQRLVLDQIKRKTRVTRDRFRYRSRYIHTDLYILYMLYILYKYTVTDRETRWHRDKERQREELALLTTPQIPIQRKLSEIGEAPHRSIHLSCGKWSPSSWYIQWPTSNRGHESRPQIQKVWNITPYHLSDSQQGEALSVSWAGPGSQGSRLYKIEIIINRAI